MSFKSTHYVWQMHHVSVYKISMYFSDKIWIDIATDFLSTIRHLSSYGTTIVSDGDSKAKFCSVRSQSNSEQCSVYHASVSENPLYLMILWKYAWIVFLRKCYCRNVRVYEGILAVSLWGIAQTKEQKFFLKIISC